MSTRFPAIGAALLLACLLSPAVDAQASPTLPEGVWLVEGTTRAYGRFRFFTRIDRAEDGINYTATKLNPTRYVPRDQTHFRGRFSADAFVARVQIAFPGFTDPEWRTHTFRYETGDGTVVTKLVLTDGPEYFDSQTEATTRDVWTYTPWPAGTLFLSNPTLNDWAYGFAQNRVENQLREVNLSLDHHRTGRESEIPPARALRIRMAAQTSVSIEKYTDYEAALQAWFQARSARSPDPDEFIPDRPHPELQSLYTFLGRNLAETKRLEDLIIAHQDGTQRMTAHMVTSVFSNIDSLTRSNREIRRAIERKRRELNLPDEPGPQTPAQRRAELRRLELAYQAASDESLMAQKALVRIATDLMLADTRIRFHSDEIVKLEGEKLRLDARFKVLDRSNRLIRIEALAGGGEGRLVYESIPPGLARDLRGLKEHLDGARDMLVQTSAMREGFKKDYMEVFNEITDNADILAWRQSSNARNLALVEAGVKLTELVIAFGTGGLAGVGVEVVTTFLFQPLLNEDRVEFSNYDETALIGAYREARQAQESGVPDPEDTCKFLQARLRDGLLPPAHYVPALDSTEGTLAGEGGELGNINQRLPDVWHHTASALLNTVNEIIAERGNYMYYSRAVKAGQRTLDALISDRAAAQAIQASDAAAHGWRLDRLRRVDKQLSFASVKAAERSFLIARRHRLLQVLAKHAGEGARRVAANANHVIAGLAADIAGAERAAREATEPAARAAAQATRARLLRQLQTQLSVSLSSIDQVANINWSRALSHLDDIVKKITERRAKLRLLRPKLKDASSFRASIRGGLFSVGVSLVLGITKDQYEEVLQEEERQVWQRIFELQLLQSLRFRAWMDASCVYWASSDIYHELSRQYYKLWRAYDPESGYVIVRNDAFRDYEGLTLRLVYEPPARQSLVVKIAGKPCAQNGAATCRVPAGEFTGLPGPYLDLEITISPAGN